MHFGKQLQVHASGDPWADYFVDYKGLKKIINSLAKGRPLDAAALASIRRRSVGASSPANGDVPGILPASTESDLLQAHKAAFFFKLDRELEKINAFYLNKEAELKVRLRALIDKRKLVQASSSGRLVRDSSSFAALCEGFRLFQRDLEKLEKFIDVNATAFRKILKKWDKRSKSTTKELYLSRQIEVSPCFNRSLISELHDAATANIAKLDSLVAASDQQAEIHAHSGADHMPSDDNTRQPFGTASNEIDALDDFEVALSQAASRQDAEGATALIQRFSPSADQTTHHLRLQRILWRVAISWKDKAPQALLDRLDYHFADDISGRTCLHEAAAAGRNDLVVNILSHGLQSSVTDIYGRQALHYASIRGHEAVVTILLTAQASLDSVDFEGQTPVTYAVTYGHAGCLRLFMHSGYQPGSPTTKASQKPILTLACEHGHAEIVKLLLEHRAIICADSAGFWPQHLAARQGFADCLTLLVAQPECKIDQVDKYSLWTPLFHAAAGGQTDCVKILLDARASVYIKDEFNYIPAHYAAWQGHIDALNLLLATRPNLIEAATGVLSPGHPDSGETRSSIDGQTEDMAIDLIPDLSLPPPIIPFRVYGHNYLDRKALMQITLGHPNTIKPALKSPIKLYHPEDQQITSFRLVMTCKSDMSAMPHNVILPLDEEERATFAFQIDSPDDFTLEFDLYPTFGSQVIGRAFALPHLFTTSTNLQAHTIPVVDAQSKLIGNLCFEANAVRPFTAARLAPGRQLETYWKASQPSTRSHSSAPTSVVTSSSLSGEYIRVVVQLTRDLIPVTYGKWMLSLGAVELNIYDLRLEQLSAFVSQTGKTLDSATIRAFKNAQDVYQAIDQTISPLETLLKLLPPALGINIEIKHPTPSDITRLGMREAADINSVVDAVLNVVYASNQDGASSSRRIVFSSFNPVICTALNWKQPNYAVLFASFCGLSRSNPVGEMRVANRFEVDQRCTSVREAANFARANNLLGVMLDSSMLVQVPSLIRAVKEFGLFLISFGIESQEALKLGSDAHVRDGVLEYEAEPVS